MSQICFDGARCVSNLPLLGHSGFGVECVSNLPPLGRSGLLWIILLAFAEVCSVRLPLSVALDGFLCLVDVSYFRLIMLLAH